MDPPRTRNGKSTSDRANWSAIDQALRELRELLPGLWTLRLRREPRALIEIEGPDSFQWPIQVSHQDKDLGPLVDHWVRSSQGEEDRLRESGEPRGADGMEAERLHTATRKGRVLVVDDEANVRDLLKTALAGAGYVVDLAGAGLAALRQIETERPDVVTLDLAMRGMSGWDLLKQLGTLPSPPPVVVISGRDAPPRSLASLPRHVWAYLSKPFPMDFLLQTCARILAVVARPPAVVSVERRRTRRRPLIVEVTLLSAEGVPVASGRVLDLSMDGAQIDLGIPLVRDSQVRLAVTLPDAVAPLIVTAEVRWKEGHVLGVRFVNPTPNVIARLCSLLD